MCGNSFARIWMVIAIVLAFSRGTWASSADQQFNVAAEAYRRGDFERATALLDDFLADHPTSELASEAQFFLAESQMQTRQYATAYENYELYLENAPTAAANRIIGARYRLGEAAYFSRDYTLAKQALTRFIELHSTESFAARAMPYLGDIALAAGDHAEALAWYSTAVRDFPRGPLWQSAQFGRARAAELDGRIDQARQYYTELIDVADGAVAEKAALQYALLEYEQRQYDVAASRLWSFANRFAESPHAPLANYYLALSRIGQNELKDAITQFRSNIRQTTNSELLVGNHFYLAETLKRRGDEAAAQIEYQRIVDNWPASIWYEKSLYQVFSYQCQNLDVDEAVAQYQKHRAELSGEYLRRARRKLAHRMLAEHRGEAVLKLLAEDHYRQAEADWYLDAAARYALEDYEGSLAATQHLNLERGSPYAESGVLMTAFSHLALGDYDAAVPYLQQYINEYPGRPQAPRCRAELLIAVARSQRRDDEQWDEVLSIWSTLTETIGPEQPARQATLRLAGLAIDANRSDLAQRCYQWLVESGVEDQITADARVGLASLDPVPKTSANTEAPAEPPKDQAETPDATQQQPVEPKTPNADARELFDTTSQLVAHGDLASARDLLADALRQPLTTYHRSAIQLALADVYQRGHDHASALQQLSRLTDADLQPDQCALRCLLQARSFVATGEVDLAEMRWLKIHTNWPASQYWREASLRLAQRLLTRNDYVAAEATLDPILESEERTPLLEHALYTRARLAVAQEKWGEALSWMQQLWGEFPDGKLALPCRVWIGECHYRQGELEQAESVFSELQEVALTRHEAWLGVVPLRMAQISAQRENWTDALAISVEIEKRFPGFQQQFEADYIIGRALAARGEFDDARQAYQRVIRSPRAGDSETIAMTQWLIGETYMHQQKYQRAIREYLRVEALYSHAPLWQAGGLLQAAKCFELTGDRVAAVQLYARLVEDYPNNTFAKQAIQRLGKIEDRIAAVSESSADG